MARRICSSSLGLLILVLFGCASPGPGTKYSSSQGGGPRQHVVRTGGATMQPAPIESPSRGALGRGLTLADFPERIVGGRLVEADGDQIVVEAKDSKPNSDPVALTNDAIITSSIRARIASEVRLRSNGFEITSSDGVVSIRAQLNSLEDALSVINLALTVPDVREIVYLLPTRV